MIQFTNDYHLANQGMGKIYKVSCMNQLRNDSKEVSLVFVYSNQCIIEQITYLAAALNKGVVETYSDPHEFLKNAYRYPKHTKFVLGRRFGGDFQYGIKIAEQLHVLGFPRLYLYSVSDLSEEGVPYYVNVIKTHELNWLESFLRDNQQFSI